MSQFKRICSITNEGMNQGWVINDGEMYIKYERDAISIAQKAGYDSLQDAFDKGYIFYTEWE